MDIQPYINIIQNLNPLEQKLSFRKDHWLKPDFNHNVVIDYVAWILEKYPEGIARQDIISSMSDDNASELLRGFLMTMIWGHGYSEHGKADNRGPWKVSKMLEDLEQTKKTLKKVNDALGENDIIMAHLAFNKIVRCRVSFFSKFLYFLGKAKKMERYPLIFDARVAKTIVRLTTTDSRISSILNVQPAQDAESYKNYVELIHSIGSQHNVEADKIEYFLFKGIDG